MSRTILRNILHAKLHRNFFFPSNLSTWSSRETFLPVRCRKVDHRDAGKILRNFSISASVVLREEMEKQFVEMYSNFKSFDVEQILELMTARNQYDLDATHLAICMKRLHSLYCEADNKDEFVEEISSDLRFKKLTHNLLVSARHLTAPIICDMVRFNYLLRCESPYMYGLLRLCTNVVSDLSMDKLAELSDVLLGVVEDIEQHVKIQHQPDDDSDWLPLIANQVELLTKCIHVLCDSKGHQLHILDMKMKIDLLLAFGAELPFLYSLLIEIHKYFHDFEFVPEELFRLLPAILNCLTQLTSLPSSPPSSVLASKISSFKNLMSSLDAKVADTLIKEIKIVKTYDVPAHSHFQNVTRKPEKMSTEERLRSVKEDNNKLKDLFYMSLKMLYEFEEPIAMKKRTINLILTSCAVYLNKNPSTNLDIKSKCIELAKLVSDNIIDNIALTDHDRFWSPSELTQILCSLSHASYFSYPLSRAVVKYVTDYYDDIRGDSSLGGEAEDSVADGDILKSLDAVFYTMNVDQLMMLFDVFAAYDFYKSPLPSSPSPLNTLLHHLEIRKETLLTSNTNLDGRMKLASCLMLHRLDVKEIHLDGIVRELEGKSKYFHEDEDLFETGRIFLALLHTCPFNESTKQLASTVTFNLHESSTNRCPSIYSTITKLWPHARRSVPLSSDRLCDFIIDCPDSDGSMKKVILNIHSDKCYWMNTTQLKPLWCLYGRKFQMEDHRVIMLNIKKFACTPDPEKDSYVRSLVEMSHHYQDLLNVV